MARSCQQGVHVRSAHHPVARAVAPPAQEDLGGSAFLLGPGKNILAVLTTTTPQLKQHLIYLHINQNLGAQL